MDRATGSRRGSADPGPGPPTRWWRESVGVHHGPLPRCEGREAYGGGTAGGSSPAFAGERRGGRPHPLPMTTAHPVPIGPGLRLRAALRARRQPWSPNPPNPLTSPLRDEAVAVEPKGDDVKQKTREKNEAKAPTKRQLEALAKAGVSSGPESKAAAQAWISRRCRPRSRRGQRGRRASGT